MLSHVNKRRTAITLVELLIAISLLGVVGTLTVRWFIMNSQYQKRLTQQSDCDNIIRNTLWDIHKDLKTAKVILYPRNNTKMNKLISDTKLVIRNFSGDIVCYYYKKETKEIIREEYFIPTGNQPSNNSRVVGKNFDCVIFTNRNETNNLVGIYMELGPSVMMDSVFLMNS